MSKAVSVVIPTRNRKESLFRLLNDLSKQTYPLEEVIVVDASDEIMDESDLQKQCPALNMVYVVSQPSVCIQRNIGIRRAEGSFVFLCDDDITLPPEYVAILMEHLRENNGAVSGLILQKNIQDKWVYQYPLQSFRHLLFAFIFQQSVWGEIHMLRVNFLLKPLFALIKAFYKSRKNTLSLAGWPVITDFSGISFSVSVYGLGASIIKKEWLLNILYEETLDPHGIGDNYGVAVGFPQPVLVVKEAKAYHHQSAKNRLDQPLTYFRRVLALHYFLKTTKKFSWWNRLLFMWSVFGNMIFHKNKMYRKASKAALKRMLTGNNPYLKALKDEVICVSPVF